MRSYRITGTMSEGKGQRRNELPIRGDMPIRLITDVLKLWGASPGRGAVDPLGRRELFV
jgi:hypothetical protein